MTNNKIGISDLFLMYKDKLNMSLHEYITVSHITSCRTISLGARKIVCPHCGNEKILYNSCRDRNCPKCQQEKGFAWSLKRSEEILPAQYFHVVFTIPKQLNRIILFNKRSGYKALFNSVKATLVKISNDKKKLGAKIGFIGVLHTWDQLLKFHPHIHCIIPNGGFTQTGKWKHGKNNYFLPVKVLSKVFRAKLVFYLKKYFKKYNLIDKKLINDVYKKEWNVNSKKTFTGPKDVFNYLGRYTHRVGISNNRIISLENDIVTFSYKDRHDGNKTKIAKLDAVSFLKRFLIHILPKRFLKIRYFGILSNKLKKNTFKKVKLEYSETKNTIKPNYLKAIYKKLSVCPNCKVGIMVSYNFKETG